MTDKVFTKNELLKALEAAGLPCDYTTLLRYERRGIVPKPKNYIDLPDRRWRTYSAEEINEIVGKVRQYRKHLSRNAGKVIPT